MPSPDEIQRIATAMNALRPDWRASSLVTFLTNHHAARPYRDLAIAALVVATDATTQTPQLLNQHGAWWVAVQAATGSGGPVTVPGPHHARCTEPGHEHELAHACRICAVEALDPADTPTLTITPEQAARNREGAALALAALEAARTTPAHREPDVRERAAGEKEDS